MEQSLLPSGMGCYKSSMHQSHCVHLFGMHSNSTLFLFFCIRRQFRRDSVYKTDWFYFTYQRSTKKLYKCSMWRALNLIFKDNFCWLHLALRRRHGKEMYGVYRELLSYFQGEIESTAWLALPSLRLPPSFHEIALGLISPILKLAFLE